LLTLAGSQTFKADVDGGTGGVERAVHVGREGGGEGLGVGLDAVRGAAAGWRCSVLGVGLSGTPQGYGANTYHAPPP